MTEDQQRENDLSAVDLLLEAFDDSGREGSVEVLPESVYLATRLLIETILGPKAAARFAASLTANECGFYSRLDLGELKHYVKQG